MSKQSTTEQLENAIADIIDNCKFAGGEDMTVQQLEAEFGLIMGRCLVELRIAFRANK